MLKRLWEVIYNNGTMVTYTYDTEGNVIMTLVEKDIDGIGINESEENFSIISNLGLKDSE